MNAVKKLSVVVAAVLLAGVSSQAIPVSGVISFQGSATVTTTGVSSWINTRVLSETGFGGLVTVGDAVAMTAPWSFNSGALSSLWSVDGFSFNLSSSSVIYQASGAVLVSGIGTITGNGYDTTAGSWIFSSKVPKRAGTITTPIFSFSVASGREVNNDRTSVPDGGTTLILLGMALSVVAVLRGILRKETA